MEGAHRGCLEPATMRRLLLVLSTIAIIVFIAARFSPDWYSSENRKLTISGVKPGMSVAEVIKVLGPPTARDTRYPFAEEEIDMWPIDTWLHYDTDCFSQQRPAKHRGPHIGLDSKGQRVVFVGGPTLEKNGKIVADNKTSFRSLKYLLGPRYCGWNADSCYGYYPGSVLVRGCVGPHGDGLRYYLRDFEEQYSFKLKERREQTQEEWEERTKLPRKSNLTPPKAGQLTMMGVYLGMTQGDLESLGLPFERNLGVSAKKISYALGDPRADQQTIRVLVSNNRVVYIDGYRLERDGETVAKASETKGLALKLILGGGPSRKHDRALLYPDQLLQVYLDEEQTLSFLSLGAQPDSEQEWPPRHDSVFRPEEVKLYYSHKP